VFFLASVSARPANAHAMPDAGYWLCIGLCEIRLSQNNLMTLKYAEELKLKAESLSKNLIVEWEKHHEVAPAVLWHYTSQAGFEGMTSSGKIWLTNAKFLNDKSEIKYGMDLIRDTLVNMKSRYSSDIIKTYLQNNSVSIRVADMTFGAYVASFSEPDDLLSQWDRYADQSRGYSLGFRTSDLTGRSHLQLRKVEYEESKQAQSIEKIAEKFCDLLQREVNPAVQWRYNDQVLRSYGHEMFSVFIQHLYCFKHRGFREEQEWRLVEMLKPVSDASRLLYRKSGSLDDVPYVTVDLNVAPPSPNKLPLVEVYYGPRLNPYDTEKYLSKWLSSHGYTPPPKITRSTIPLR
jgi:hypothetical protein